MYDEASFAQRASPNTTSYQQHRSSVYSSNDEIDLTEILHEMPEPHEHHHEHQNYHNHHNHSIPSSNPSNNPNSGNTNTNNNDNVVILAIKLIFALIFTQLQKLPISARIVHQFLILHFILSSIGLSQYLMLCPTNIIDKYQYWRFITYNFADTNVFMALLGCITLSDIMKRMEYYFGSIWTLYLVLINWIFVSLFTFIIQYILIKYLSFLPSIFTECGGIGIYPMIFSLSIIEIVLSLPFQINHIFGIIYLPQIYHPIIYCFLYNLLIRFDIATIIAVTYNLLLIYCIPSIFHLSRYRIQKIQNSKWLQCMVNDKLFIPIERIDYDCFISTGKYISAESDKNTDLLLHHHQHHQSEQNQSFHSTMMLQTQIQRNMSDSYSYNQQQMINNDDDHHNNNNNNNDDDDNSDREDLPFIISHGHESDLSNISSHQSYPSNNGVSPAVMRNTSHAIQQKYNNMPVNRKRG